MSSQTAYSFSDIIRDLDTAIALLNKAVNNLKSYQVNSDDFRIKYDNYPLTIGLAISWLIFSVRKNCVSETGTMPLALFTVRTLQELCIQNAAVNYLAGTFSKEQKKILQESRLMQFLASEKDQEIMGKILDDEKNNISEKCFKDLKTIVNSYDPSKHYEKKGFYHNLNERASKKITELFKQIDNKKTLGHPVFNNYNHDNSSVIFSNLLHGNPTGVLVASDTNDPKPTMPFMLLRLSLYDTELIAVHLGDRIIERQVTQLIASTMQKAYG